jgi:O-antigen ligase
LASVALGQLGRIPPLSGGAPLIADGLLGGIFLTWLVWAIWNRVPFPRSRAHMAWAAFLVVALVALLLTPYPLGRRELIESGLYWVRLLMYSSLAWIVPMIYRTDAALLVPFRYLVGASLAVLGAGVVQLIVLPDIGLLSGFGWDPHVGRFVSTFLDPNYLGGYLALMLSFSFAMTLGTKPRNWVWLMTVATLVAGVLTYSRSGYLALLVVLLIIGLMYSWKLLLVGVVCVVPLALSIPRVAERVQGGFNIDRTSQDRIDSWGRALTIFRHHPVIGVGYNNYHRAQQELQLVSPIGESHASGGSDSSLLNVAATTGLVGFTLFALAGVLMLRDALRTLRRKASSHAKTAAYAVLIATPALLVNAFFVNALFYPLIMLPLAFMVGAMYVGAPGFSPAPQSRTNS